MIIAVRFVPVREELGDDPHTDAPRVPWTQRLRESLTVWADPRLLLIGVVVLGMSFAEGSANDWLALAVVDGHGYDATIGAAIFAVFTVAMTAARVLGGPVLDRFGRVRMLQVLAVVGVIGLTLFIFGTEPWMLIVGTVLWGIGARSASPSACRPRPTSPTAGSPPPASAPWRSSATARSSPARRCSASSASTSACSTRCS